jgi:UDP-2,3-diacylglucosamine pyrophosphatase LpxH
MTRDRLLVLSDLHLAVEPELSSYAGLGLLKPALDAWVPKKLATRTTVVLNGDVLDLLTVLDPGLGTNQQRQGVMEDLRDRVTKLFDSAAGREAREALQLILGRGAEVIIRPGNHDLELHAPELQAHVRRGIDPQDRWSKLLRFHTETTQLFELGGGLRVAVAHGDDADPDNRYAPRQAPPFEYPVGSLIVQHVVNPAKRAGLLFIDRMEPNLQGALFTALHVDRHAFEGLGVHHDGILGSLLPPRVIAIPGTAWRWLRSFVEAPYKPEEIISEPLSYAAGWLSGGWLQRGSLPDISVEDLAPSEQEWRQAKPLIEEHKADVVILGHTHQPRLGARSSRVFANPGSWTWRLTAPSRSSGLAWNAFIDELRDRHRRWRTATDKTDPSLGVDDLSVRQPGAVLVDGQQRRSTSSARRCRSSSRRRPTSPGWSAPWRSDHPFLSRPLHRRRLPSTPWPLCSTKPPKAASAGSATRRDGCSRGRCEAWRMTSSPRFIAACSEGSSCRLLTTLACGHGSGCCGPS